MTRRPPVRPPRAARMAPGGRRWSESPIRRPYPRVRQMGAELPPVELPESRIGLSTFAASMILPGMWVGRTVRVFVGDRLLVLHQMGTYSTPTVSFPGVTFSAVVSTTGAYEPRAWLSDVITEASLSNMVEVVTAAETEVQGLLVCRVARVHPTSPFDVSPTGMTRSTGFSWTHLGVTTTRPVAVGLQVLGNAPWPEGGTLEMQAGSLWWPTSLLSPAVASYGYADEASEAPGPTGPVTWVRTGTGLTTPTAGSSFALALRHEET